jgi:hypothetical protein
MNTRRCYKYPVVYKATKFSLMLPQGAQFLRVNWQGQDLFAWYLVDTTAPVLQKDFLLYGTGHDVAPGAKWVTTFDNGPFVIHMFEVPRG